jgi:hypothetical protein
MIEALSSSDTSVLSRATQRNFPDDAILHSHRRENLKSYGVCLILFLARFLLEESKKHKDTGYMFWVPFGPT